MDETKNETTRRIVEWFRTSTLRELARQRGAPVELLTDELLDALTVEELQRVGDTLHELVYAPPPGRRGP